VGRLLHRFKKTVELMPQAEHYSLAAAVCSTRDDSNSKSRAVKRVKIKSRGLLDILVNWTGSRFVSCQSQSGVGHRES
jgi:hypothetical protein